jgi:putative nucleotidyltransferase with HDIG domain
MTSVPEERSALTADDADALLEQFVRPGETWCDHCRVVSRTSRDICSALLRRGIAVDIEFASTAGLLHDIGRSVTHHPSMHGWEGYLILKRRGYLRHAHVCLNHVLIGRSLDGAIEEGLLPQGIEHPEDLTEISLLSLESKVVSVADALTLDTCVVTLEVRYARSFERYPEPFMRRNYDLALELQGELEALLGQPVGAIVH